MNISIKQYATTLYKIIDGKSKNEVGQIIKEFAAVLVVNNDQGKLKKIIEAFSVIWNKEKGIVEAEVLSANELSKDVVKLLNGYITKLSGAREVVIREKVEKNLLGGVVIKYGDRVVDRSLKTKISDLKNNMVK